MFLRGFDPSGQGISLMDLRPLLFNYGRICCRIPFSDERITVSFSRLWKLFFKLRIHLPADMICRWPYSGCLSFWLAISAAGYGCKLFRSQDADEDFHFPVLKWPCSLGTLRTNSFSGTGYRCAFCKSQEFRSQSAPKSPGMWVSVPVPVTPEYNNRRQFIYMTDFGIKICEVTDGGFI